jgi:hypothetical protein
MLTRRRASIAGLLAVVLSVASCQGACMFAEPWPYGGVAKVGDEYFAYLPVCGREVTGYRMIRPEVGGDWEPIDEDAVYWQAGGPTADAALSGWVAIGSTEDFTEVPVSLPEDFSWPDRFVVDAFVDSHPDGDFSFSAIVFDLADVPEYDAGADLETIKYLEGDKLKTPRQLRKGTGLC